MEQLKKLLRHFEIISRTVKTLMAEKNEIQRLKFALSFVNPNGQFHGMFDYIHIV